MFSFTVGKIDDVRWILGIVKECMNKNISINLDKMDGFLELTQ